MVLFFTCIICSERNVGTAGQQLCSDCVNNLECYKCEKKVLPDTRNFVIDGSEIICSSCHSSSTFQHHLKTIEKIFEKYDLSDFKSDEPGYQPTTPNLIPSLPNEVIGTVFSYLPFPSQHLANFVCVNKSWKLFFDTTNFYFIEYYGSHLKRGKGRYETYEKFILRDLKWLLKFNNFRGFGHLKGIRLGEGASIKDLLLILHFVPKKVNRLEEINTRNLRSEIHPSLTGRFMELVNSENVKFVNVTNAGMIEKIMGGEEKRVWKNVKKVVVQGKEEFHKISLKMDIHKFFPSVEELHLFFCKNFELENMKASESVKSLVLDTSRSIKGYEQGFKFPKLEKLRIVKDSLFSGRYFKHFESSTTSIKVIELLDCGPMDLKSFYSFVNLEKLIVPNAMMTMRGFEGFFKQFSKLKEFRILSILMKYFLRMLVDARMKVFRVKKIVMREDDYDLAKFESINTELERLEIETGVGEKIHAFLSRKLKDCDLKLKV